ncbi:hypothetical protein HNY73_021255 [Argiope bruennichi]|uniref:Uncharacterized protein n=1 Tax=Argiope bruennichi TaxID=94029 RepID=A0A8T0EC92_ARGBR|nr:hypothetical protein HNY73_021255 [Argiope bruennichi]
MEEGATRTDHNEKENSISTSPDSGMCDLDTNSDDQTKPPPSESASSPPPRSQPYPEGRFRYTQNYDPFFFKYATDNRKLTLLKSLSQDSEYSLDTSLFDAEEFLQDMGFAGSSDPTIPDRFLPSLMQRLSKFPESEMESLHHRIVQSIGCFRRKEGKRRLFRNLSMGKDSPADHFGKNHLPCPSNNYPLLRSNTGPAEFPFNEATTSAFEVSHNNSLKKGCLSSSDSGHHSMDSLKNEGELPESPIAILVSSASVEQDDKSLQEDTDKGVQVAMNDDEVLFDDFSSDSPPAAEIIQKTSDGEFMNTVHEIQKLTDDIANNEDLASFSKNSDNATEETELDQENTSDWDEDSTADSKCDRSSPEEENLPESVEDIVVEAENQISLLHCDKSVLPKKNAPVKRPLRRISNAQIYNPLRHSKGFGSLEHQNKVNEDDDLDIEHSSVLGTTPTFNESNDNTNPFKISECDDASRHSSENCGLLSESIPNFKSDFSEISSDNIDSIPFSSKEKKIPSLSSNTDSSQFCSGFLDYSENSSNRMIAADGNSGKETLSFTKRKFCRDDSLTNFLSSMLGMSESDSVLQPYVTPLNSPVENQSKSDSEILQDNFSSEKFSVQYDSKKAQFSEVVSKTHRLSPSAQNLNSDVKSVPDKPPNRKRRVLRRMSSSLQCCDDANCEDPDKLTVTEGFQFSSTNPFASPKLPLRYTKSGYHNHVSGHRPVHPCSSLPAMKLYSSYKIQNETGHYTNPFAYTTTDGIQSNSDPEASKFYYRKKEKRNCKKRRYLSTTDTDLYFNSWNRDAVGELSKLNSFDVDMHNHECLPDSVYDCNPDTHNYCICSYNHSRTHLNERYPAWEHCFHKENKMPFSNCHFFPSSHYQHSRSATSRGVKESARYCMWNSTPDIRYGCCSSAFKEHCGISKLNSVHDLSLDHRGNLSAASSFCDDAHLSDDVFFPEKVPYCCAHSSHPPDNVQSNNSRRLKVRLPQRQNSMSIDDADDRPFPNRKTSIHRNDFQNIFCKSGFISGECSSNSSSPPDGPSRKVSVITSAPNIPNDLQKKVQHNEMNPVPAQDKLLHSFDSHCTNSIKNGPNLNNKNEALLERKIRIFSKFFTNLGNLSKSIHDRHSDNEHKEKRNARFYDVIGTDKPRKSDIRADFKAIPPRKCSTPPPEFDRLIKTRSSSLESSDECHSTNREIVRPIYENRVVLQAIPRVEGNQRHFKPLQFTSSVSMYINSDENKEESNFRRKDDLAQMGLNREASFTKSDENSRPSSQMSFKVASKELEDLQQSIQKAKEMRMSASKELHLLQELLSGDDNTDGKSEAEKGKKFPTVHPAVCLKDATFRRTEIKENKALKDLREKSKKEVLEDNFLWQEEIRKVKEETNRAWQEKFDRMEARLASQEEELRRLQAENENLHKGLELQRLGSPTCQCRSESGQNGFGRIDSAFEDDEEYFNHKPSIPIQSTRQECDRLQERLTEEEQRADQLKLLLNQKLIEFNKLQITLSKQTKEMIELEKSYLQLQCRLRKGTSKPMVARLCSRTSPFNSKNLCPKPSPPATPQPNSVS